MKNPIGQQLRNRKYRRSWLEMRGIIREFGVGSPVIGQLGYTDERIKNRLAINFFLAAAEVLDESDTEK